MSDYPRYVLEMKAEDGVTYEVDGVPKETPIEVRGTHAFAIVKDGVRTSVTIVHHDEDDPYPHLLITFD